MTTITILNYRVSNTLFIIHKKVGEKMPSSMTHTYLCQDIYQKLPKKYQNKINNKIEYFKLFSQGSDPYMFYHFFIGKKAKYTMNLQNTIHSSKTQKFFINTINYISKNNLENNPEIMSFLYGYITHYYLDLYTHPLIYYKTGIFKKDNKNTYKYNGLHQEIEYNIDLYMIKEREKIPPYKFKIHKEIFNIKKLSKELKQLINTINKETYQIDKTHQLYEASIHYMTLFFKIVNYDPTGIKLKIYQILDKAKPKKLIKLEELSYHHNFETNLSYLNLNHNTWNYPWDKSQTFKTSFFDLYNKAKEESINTIITITNMLDNKKIDEEKLKTIFPNLSLVTGLPCQNKIEMKYFEF